MEIDSQMNSECECHEARVLKLFLHKKCKGKNVSKKNLICMNAFAVLKI